MNERRQRWVLPVLAIIFLAPLLLAMVIYHKSSWRPDSGLQHGELIDSAQVAPLPVADDLLLGRWTLLYRSDSSCDDSCHNLLDTLRRVRLAQDRAMGRVQCMLVLSDATRYSRANDTKLQVVAAKNWPLPAEQVFLVDPRGVPVLRYRAGFDPRGLIKDLQRLLRLAGES